MCVCVCVCVELNTLSSMVSTRFNGITKSHHFFLTSYPLCKTAETNLSSYVRPKLMVIHL